jgi:hypothetical protein
LWLWFKKNRLKKSGNWNASLKLALILLARGRRNESKAKTMCNERTTSGKNSTGKG